MISILGSPYTPPGASSLSVLGPSAGGSTDEAIARFDGATGKLLQNSIITIGDTGLISLGATGLIAYPGVNRQIVGGTLYVDANGHPVLDGVGEDVGSYQFDSDGNPNIQNRQNTVVFLSDANNQPQLKSHGGGSGQIGFDSGGQPQINTVGSVTVFGIDGGTEVYMKASSGQGKFGFNGGEPLITAGDGSNGVTNDTFTSLDAKTVTVKNGIIVSIV